MKTLLTKNQKKIFTGYLHRDGKEILVKATVRHDDECNNGHNTFSITGEIPSEGCCGCIHKEIAEAIPMLAPFIKWHLTSTDGPMYYLENTTYLAGERDCDGLLKGEFKQHTSRGKQNDGVPNVPNWVLELPERKALDVYSVAKPEPVILEWKAYGRTGVGKKRELDAARSCAVWPEATDEELCSPDLKTKLKARLPALMAEFQAAVESLGFVY